MKKLFCVLAAAVTVSPVGSETQAATDEKVYPAIMCQSAGNDPNDGVGVHRRPGGAVENRSQRRVELLCPIVRDTVSKPWVRMEILVRDNHSTENVECEVRNRERDGDHAGNVKKSSAGTGAQAIVFPSSPPQADRGPFLISCTLPASTGQGPSAIVNYLVAEED